MAIHLQSHAFASNPLRSSIQTDRSFSPLESLKSLLEAAAEADVSAAATSRFKVLAFRKGQPLVRSSDPTTNNSPPRWALAYASPPKFKDFSADSFVFLGTAREGEDEDNDSGALYWAVDVSTATDLGLDGDGLCFVDLRTLMVATDWTDAVAMGDLAVAGHARALLEWHNASLFCGHCGASTASIDSGRRKQCIKESCKRRLYPRVDPVVIMLVIDKENDRALLSRQSRFAPRMWSCLAGFIEPGESLEEAVRRETWEETGIEVNEVVYHSSQPWPVGPSSMPCQLMVGFFAYAKSLDINVDKKELDDAQWHNREDVKKALTFTEYENAQRKSAFKINQMCKGAENGQRLSDFNAGNPEFAQMFVPGPFAIAHHLISSWAFGGAMSSNISPAGQLNPVSNL